MRDSFPGYFRTQFSSKFLFEQKMYITVSIGAAAA